MQRYQFKLHEIVPISIEESLLVTRSSSTRTLDYLFLAQIISADRLKSAGAKSSLEFAPQR